MIRGGAHTSTLRYSPLCTSMTTSSAVRLCPATGCVVQGTQARNWPLRCVRVLALVGHPANVDSLASPEAGHRQTHNQARSSLLCMLPLVDIPRMQFGARGTNGSTPTTSKRSVEPLLTLRVRRSSSARKAQTLGMANSVSFTCFLILLKRVVVLAVAWPHGRTARRRTA